MLLSSNFSKKHDFVKDAELQDDWKTCTTAMCPTLTNCILTCETMECKIDCVENFEKDHQNFYHRWEGLPDFDHADCANDPNCLLK